MTISAHRILLLKWFPENTALILGCDSQMSEGMVVVGCDSHMSEGLVVLGCDSLMSEGLVVLG